MGCHEEKGQNIWRRRILLKEVSQDEKIIGYKDDCLASSSYEEKRSHMAASVSIGEMCF